MNGISLVGQEVAILSLCIWSKMGDMGKLDGGRRRMECHRALEPEKWLTQAMGIRSQCKIGSCLPSTLVLSHVSPPPCLCIGMRQGRGNGSLLKRWPSQSMRGGDSYAQSQGPRSAEWMDEWIGPEKRERRAVGMGQWSQGGKEIFSKCCFICQIMVKCISQKQNGPLLAQTSAEFLDKRRLHLSQGQSPLGGIKNRRWWGSVSWWCQEKEAEGTWCLLNHLGTLGAGPQLHTPMNPVRGEPNGPHSNPILPEHFDSCSTPQLPYWRPHTPCNYATSGCGLGPFSRWGPCSSERLNDICPWQSWFAARLGLDFRFFWFHAWVLCPRGLLSIMGTSINMEWLRYSWAKGNDISNVRDCLGSHTMYP